LESLLATHFGTPLTTPAGAQESGEDESEDDTEDIDLRARRYVDEMGEPTDEGEDVELCLAGQEDADRVRISLFLKVVGANKTAARKLKAKKKGCSFIFLTCRKWTNLTRTCT